MHPDEGAALGNGVERELLEGLHRPRAGKKLSSQLSKDPVRGMN